MATWFWLHTNGDIKVGIQGGDGASNVSIGEIFRQGRIYVQRFAQRMNVACQHPEMAGRAV